MTRDDGVAKGGEIFGVDGHNDFWLKVRLNSRVSKDSFFVKRCVFSALAIWVAVPARFGTRTPGSGGRVNGSVGAI